MSDDKPTAADRSAGTQPGCRCTAHCEHVHGDQAEDEETRELFRLRAELRAGFAREDAFRAEVARFRDRLEEYRREVERRDEYLRGADDEMLSLKGQLAHFAVRLESAEGTLNRHGFRRCDIPACNCGWWHAPEVKR